MKSKLIGKVVHIKDKDSWYNGEWGVVAWYDGEVYGVKIANGGNNEPIFGRDQFHVPRNQDAMKRALLLNDK